MLSRQIHPHRRLGLLMVSLLHHALSFTSQRSSWKLPLELLKFDKLSCGQGAESWKATLYGAHYRHAAPSFASVKDDQSAPTTSRTDSAVISADKNMGKEIALIEYGSLGARRVMKWNPARAKFLRHSRRPSVADQTAASSKLDSGGQGQMMRQKLLQSLVPHSSRITHVKDSLHQLFKNCFVPGGDISNDYYIYARWRAAQRLASATTTVFAAQALLLALGIKKSKLGLAAATTWVLKDALGKVSRVVWAERKGGMFDSDAKKWRFRSSVLYAIGNALEIFTYIMPSMFLAIAAVANALKQMSMLTSSATRNTIYKCFSPTGDNIGDITAKGESQIAVVDLIGLGLGVKISTVMNASKAKIVGAFVFLTFFDLFCIYQEIRCVVFRMLNFERTSLVLPHLFSAIDAQLAQQQDAALLDSGDEEDSRREGGKEQGNSNILKPSGSSTNSSTGSSSIGSSSRSGTSSCSSGSVIGDSAKKDPFSSADVGESQQRSVSGPADTPPFAESESSVSRSPIENNSTIGSNTDVKQGVAKSLMSETVRLDQPSPAVSAEKNSPSSLAARNVSSVDSAPLISSTSSNTNNNNNDINNSRSSTGVIVHATLDFFNKPALTASALEEASAQESNLQARDTAERAVTAIETMESVGSGNFTVQLEKRGSAATSRLGWLPSGIKNLFSPRKATRASEPTADATTTEMVQPNNDSVGNPTVSKISKTTSVGAVTTAPTSASAASDKHVQEKGIVEEERSSEVREEDDEDDSLASPSVLYQAFLERCTPQRIAQREKLFYPASLSADVVTRWSGLRVDDSLQLLDRCFRIFGIEHSQTMALQAMQVLDSSISSNSSSSGIGGIDSVNNSSGIGSVGGSSYGDCTSSPSSTLQIPTASMQARNQSSAGTMVLVVPEVKLLRSWWEAMLILRGLSARGEVLRMANGFPVVLRPQLLLHKQATPRDIFRGLVIVQRLQHEFSALPHVQKLPVRRADVAAAALQKVYALQHEQQQRQQQLHGEGGETTTAGTAVSVLPKKGLFSRIGKTAPVASGVNRAVAGAIAVLEGESPPAISSAETGFLSTHAGLDTEVVAGALQRAVEYERIHGETVMSLLESCGWKTDRFMLGSVMSRVEW